MKKSAKHMTSNNYLICKMILRMTGARSEDPAETDKGMVPLWLAMINGMKMEF